VAADESAAAGQEDLHLKPFAVASAREHAASWRHDGLCAVRLKVRGGAMRDNRRLGG
jgi:hypothetical protein